MWYGSKLTKNLSKKLQNYRNRINWKDRRFTKPVIHHWGYPATTFRFQVPIGWHFLMLQPTNVNNTSNTIYAFNDIHFLNFKLSDFFIKLHYDPNTHTLTLYRFDATYSYLRYLKTIANVISSLHKPFFLKIKFKGKGYYVYKNFRNTIAPQFNYAHRVYVYSFLVSVKFLSKTKIFMFGLSQRDLFKIGYLLFFTRPINVFTGRGVRFARQIIYRKTGKIGAYR